MFKNIFKKQQDVKSTSNNINIFNPIAGEIISIEKVPDQVFSEKMLGDGFAIIPSGNKVYAPIAGEIKILFPTLHALAIETVEGIELLLHIGIDTVELKGEGFIGHVKVGDLVKQGDLLITFDSDIIKSKATSIITPVLITNMEVISDISVDYGNCKENQIVATVRKR